MVFQCGVSEHVIISVISFYCCYLLIIL